MTIQEIQQLEDFFTQAGKQQVPIYLNQATIITDYAHFLESHFMPLKLNPDAKVNLPLIHRLKMLKLLIESNA
ncbi:hypothetical protein ASU31_23365 [Pedobacter ginsenosidimutans]|uniref:DUF6965 domain-containing protein n=1 Tax=Pedobacter ginsenosidimutans TaxID=687842 RepID=A0A0T5VIL0_9SPHI|nr:hypothetical protein [Pedobacter ginsenosidimutans]KRT13687.1 hypothetical protein ASU31_23365 [Pedobacter ginsenosidimutans]